MVCDSGLSRVSIFDQGGSFARSFALSGAETPRSVAGVYGDGALLVLTTPVFTTASEPGPRRDVRSYLRFDPLGDSLGVVGGFADDERFVRNSGGAMSMSRLLLGKTTSVALLGRRLYVGTNDAFSIDEYDTEGRLIRSMRREVDPTSVSATILQAELTRQLDDIPEAFRDRIRPLYDEMPTPEILPYYSTILVDSEGYLWVRHFAGSPADEPQWTVFDREGRMLGQVATPHGLEVYEIGSDYVLGRWRDESDVEHVRLHSLVRTGPSGPVDPDRIE